MLSHVNHYCGKAIRLSLGIDPFRCVEPDSCFPATARVANFWNGCIQLLTALIFFVPLLLLTILSPVAGWYITPRSLPAEGEDLSAYNNSLLAPVGIGVGAFGAGLFCTLATLASAHAMIGAHRILLSLTFSRPINFRQLLSSPVSSDTLISDYPTSPGDDSPLLALSWRERSNRESNGLQQL